MYRTTTPTHSFELPFEVSLIEKLILTYKQGDIVLEFDESDVTMSSKTISITLTQAQTKMFLPGEDILIQMKILTTGNAVVASNLIKLKVKSVLNETEFDADE